MHGLSAQFAAAASPPPRRLMRCFGSSLSARANPPHQQVQGRRLSPPPDRAAARDRDAVLYQRQARHRSACPQSKRIGAYPRARPDRPPPHPPQRLHARLGQRCRQHRLAPAVENLCLKKSSCHALTHDGRAGEFRCRDRCHQRRRGGRVDGLPRPVQKPCARACADACGVSCHQVVRQRRPAAAPSTRALFDLRLSVHLALRATPGRPSRAIPRRRAHPRLHGGPSRHVLLPRAHHIGQQLGRFSLR